MPRHRGLQQQPDVKHAAGQLKYQYAG